MILSDICIKRPVLATVLNLIIILLGLVAFQRLTIREYPNIDPPVVNVETYYPGADAEIIESQVTTPLEDSLSGIEGLDYITSTSSPELSKITIKFLLNRDPNAALSDVRDKIQRVRDRLPDDVKEPITTKVQANAEPIIWLTFSTDRFSPLEVTDIADRLVKDRIQTISGVADIMIFGERRYAMRIWMDPERLAGYRLTPQDIEDALRKQNIEIPGGRIQGTEREFSVLSVTDLNTPEQFEQLILKDVNGYLVRLKDVAKVEIGPKDERRIARFNGDNAIALGIVKQSTANPLEVSNDLRKVMPEIIASLPEGVKIEIAYDSSRFIHYSIKSVFTTIIEAMALVIAVIFLFLRSVRSTLIPLVTIPVSLIGVFALMNLFGFSINTITLLAMVLAIGLVVDDAIVVLENIYRHIEEGMPPLEAALTGSREIGFAVVAMTLTLAAVFTPIAFSTGMTGKLFIEFALTLAGAVIVSGFTALTLSPMMCSRMLKHETQHGRFYMAVENKINLLHDYYQIYLKKTLSIRPRVVGVAIAAFFVTGALLYTLKSELAPTEDKGVIMAIAVAPEGATVNYSTRYVKQLEALYRGTPGIKNYFSAIGFPSASRSMSFVELLPWGERASQQSIVAELGPKMFFGVTGVMAFPMNPPSLGQSFISQPIEVVLQTSQSYEELLATTNKILNEARKNPELQNLDSNLQLNTPQLKISVDRDKVAAVGTQVETVSRTIESMLSGRQVTRFKHNAKQYDVIIQVPEKDRLTPHNLYSIYVRGQNENMIPLSNLITVQEKVAPRELAHFNKLRSATITANLGSSYSLAEGLKFMEDTIHKIAPPSYQIEYGGVSREYKESSQSIFFIFGLALCFIYLVLAAQFESFIDPFIILLSVPLALAGALLTLTIFGGTLNIYSQIGLITLVGLISKHGILIVEFSNQLRHKGYAVIDAVTEAAVLRLRPILMTTGAMVLGSLPLVFAGGAGAESRHQMGLVIVGGLVFGTLLTLFVVPTIYSYLAKK